MNEMKIIYGKFNYQLFTSCLLGTRRRNGPHAVVFGGFVFHLLPTYCFGGGSEIPIFQKRLSGRLGKEQLKTIFEFQATELQELLLNHLSRY